jgi:hypothetical protein
MKGTLKDKTAEGVTIERPGLPAADLDIRDKTLVWLDGKKVDKDALPEGAQVRAKFQLEGQDIVAVELRATSANKPATKKSTVKPMDNNNTLNNDATLNDSTGGSGMLRDDANQMGSDVKSGATDMKNEVKDEANETSDDVNKSLR